MAPTIPVYTLDLTQEVVGSGVHGYYDHYWTRDGWSVFTPVVITADGAQVFNPIVTGGIGAVVGTQPGAGSLRIAYLRNGTNWANSEVKSIFWGPMTPWSGTNSQQGHLHRVREISPGLWEGIAIWTSIVFGGDYSFLHVAAVRWNGTTLWMGTEPGNAFGAADQSWITRTVRVMGHRRFQFIQWFNEYTIQQPDYLRHLPIGTRLAISSLGDATFNEADIALNSASTSNGTISVVEPTTLSAVAYTVDGTGDISPIGPDLQKRYCPYGLATRVVGGSASSVTVELKRWRLDEPEPDWGESRVRRGVVTPSVDVPEVAVGPGLSGFWAAHFNGGSAGGWGDASFRALTK